MAPGIGSIAFFPAAGPDQFNAIRPVQPLNPLLNLIQSRLNPLLVLIPGPDTRAHKTQKLGFGNRLLGFDPGGAIKGAQPLNKIILAGQQFPAPGRGGKMKFRPDTLPHQVSQNNPWSCYSRWHSIGP